AIPEHPYNARMLDRRLRSLTLPQRDAWWSIWLCEQEGRGGAVDRVVDWAWHGGDKSHISAQLPSTNLAQAAAPHRDKKSRARRDFHSLVGNCRPPFDHRRGFAPVRQILPTRLPEECGQF